MAPTQRKTSKKAAGTTTRAWEALTPALSEWILEFVSSMGYKQMQPVQANTIPVFMGNKDVVVEVSRWARAATLGD
jgi:ATP-dependent RNA helicase DDX55/SPB4